MKKLRAGGQQLLLGPSGFPRLRITCSNNAANARSTKTMTLFFFIEVRPAHLGGAAASCSHFFNASLEGIFPTALTSSLIRSAGVPNTPSAVMSFISRTCSTSAGRPRSASTVMTVCSSRSQAGQPGPRILMLKPLLSSSTFSPRAFLNSRQKARLYSSWAEAGM